MTPDVKVMIGVGVAIGGLIWLSSRKKTTPSLSAPPQEQLPVCPAGQHRDGLVCVPDVAQPPPGPLTNRQAAEQELAAFASVEILVVLTAIKSLKDGGVQPAGLSAYVGELQKMTPVIKNEVLDAMNKSSPADQSALTTVAKNLVQFYPQLARQLVVLAHYLQAGGLTPEVVAATRAVAEKSSGQVHGVPIVFEWMEAA